MHVYIAPEPGSKALYSIIIPDSELFLPSTHLNSQGSIQRMLRLKVQRVTQTDSHHFSFLWMSEPVTT